jgi:hypothetical protein
MDRLAYYGIIGEGVHFEGIIGGAYQNRRLESERKKIGASRG